MSALDVLFVPGAKNIVLDQWRIISEFGSESFEEFGIKKG